MSTFEELKEAIHICPPAQPPAPPSPPSPIFPPPLAKWPYPAQGAWVVAPPWAVIVPDSSIRRGHLAATPTPDAAAVTITIVTPTPTVAPAAAEEATPLPTAAATPTPMSTPTATPTPEATPAVERRRARKVVQVSEASGLQGLLGSVWRQRLQQRMQQRAALGV